MAGSDGGEYRPTDPTMGNLIRPFDKTRKAESQEFRGGVRFALPPTANLYAGGKVHTLLYTGGCYTSMYIHTIYILVYI